MTSLPNETQTNTKIVGKAGNATKLEGSSPDSDASSGSERSPGSET